MANMLTGGECDADLCLLGESLGDCLLSEGEEGMLSGDLRRFSVSRFSPASSAVVVNEVLRRRCGAEPSRCSEYPVAEDSSVSCAASSFFSESDEASDHLSKDKEGCSPMWLRSISSFCSVLGERFRISGVSSRCPAAGDTERALALADSVGLTDCSRTLSGFCTLPPFTSGDSVGDVFLVASAEGDTRSRVSATAAAILGSILAISGLTQSMEIS